MNKLHLAMVYLNGLIELLSSNKLVSEGRQQPGGSKRPVRQLAVVP